MIRDDEKTKKSKLCDKTTRGWTRGREEEGSVSRASKCSFSTCSSAFKAFRGRKVLEKNTTSLNFFTSTREKKKKTTTTTRSFQNGEREEEKSVLVVVVVVVQNCER